MLSGGERNRLLLARLFAKPSNLLVMDEPTNDLDAETLDLLEELIGDYAGTLLLVSHDRAFLDNVVTSTLVFEGDGRIDEYVGGYTDWVRQRRAAPPAKAATAAAARPLPTAQASAAAARGAWGRANAHTRSSASSTRCRDGFNCSRRSSESCKRRSAIRSCFRGNRPRPAPSLQAAAGAGARDRDRLCALGHSGILRRQPSAPGPPAAQQIARIRQCCRRRHRE